jgi:hypothetical protein
VVAVFVLPAFVVPDGFLSGDAYRDNDWLNTRTFDLLAAWGWSEDGAPPLWTPWLGGGYPLAVHPSDSSLSPLLVPILLFGDVLGVKINLALLLLAGAWGVRSLARELGGLEEPAAALAGALFAVSGWLPGMILIGFYPQALQLLALPAAALALRGHPQARLGAAVLLALLLQQGGHAWPAALVFVGLVVLGREAVRVGLGGPALAALFVAAAPWSFARHAPALAVGLGCLGAGALAGWPRARRLPAALASELGGLVMIVAGACALGAVRIAGLLWARGRHTYGDGPWQPGGWWFGEAWRPGSGPHPGDFYRSGGELFDGLLHHAPAVARYAVGEAPLELESGYLGLTVLPLMLAAVGAVGSRQRLVAVLAALYLGISLGPTLPPDLHFLLFRGLPDLGGLAQPLKYHCLFLSVPLCVLSAAGASRVLDRLRSRSGGRGGHLLPAALAVVVLLPVALHNAPTWRVRFAHPPAAAVALEGVAGAVPQVALTSRPAASWAEARGRDRDDLTSYRRPSAAQEYDNVRRRVATVGWYASFGLPSSIEPAHFVLPDGTLRPNPAFEGFALDEFGRPLADDAIVARPGGLELHPAGAREIRLNLDFFEGFRAAGGSVEAREGRVVVVVEPGATTVRLRWCPRWLQVALAVNGLAWLAAVGLAVRWRRRLGSHPQQTPRRMLGA